MMNRQIAIAVLAVPAIVLVLACSQPENPRVRAKPQPIVSLDLATTAEYNPREAELVSSHDCPRPGLPF